MGLIGLWSVCLQSISFRNAFWAEIDAEVDGYLPGQTLMPDLIHPNKRGVELLGNLVIKFLTDAQVHMTRLGHGSHSSSSHLPLPLYVDAAMDDQSNTCTRGDALQDMMVHTVDWYWIDGKKPGGPMCPEHCQHSCWLVKQKWHCAC